MKSESSTDLKIHQKSFFFMTFKLQLEQIVGHEEWNGTRGEMLIIWCEWSWMY